ncbi:hypothetical protein NPIL_633941, partial [Nephila pilipes]
MHSVANNIKKACQFAFTIIARAKDATIDPQSPLNLNLDQKGHFGHIQLTK